MKNLVIISFLLLAGCISTSFDTRVYLVNEYFWNSFDPDPVFKVESGDFVHVGKSDKKTRISSLSFLRKQAFPFQKAPW